MYSAQPHGTNRGDIDFGGCFNVAGHTTVCQVVAPLGMYQLAFPA